MASGPASTTATHPPQRLLQLDGLRALAALTVVAFHYTTRYEEVFPGAATLPGLRWGHLGVNLFFAISGFVIFMTLDRCRSALEFLASRIARLYPAYWGAIALTVLVTALLPVAGQSVGFVQVLANLTMLHRFFDVRDVDGVYWSLQIELIFYAWMLLLWAAGALRHPRLVCGLWIAASLVHRAAPDLGGITVPPEVENGTLLYWFPWFAIGILTCVPLRDPARHGDPTSGAAASPAGASTEAQRPDAARIALLALAIVAASWGEGLAKFGCALSAAVLLHAAARRQLPALQWPTLVFCGAISYPLYLVHQRIGWAIIQHVGDTSIAARLSGIALAILASLGLAWLLHRWVEEPGRRSLRAAFALRIRTPRITPRSR